MVYIYIICLKSRMKDGRARVLISGKVAMNVNQKDVVEARDETR